MSHERKVEAQKWINSGMLMSRSGNLQEASKCYGKAIEFDESSHIAWFNKGTTLMRLKEHARARECFHKAIALHPLDPDYHINLGHTYEIGGYYEQGLLAYQNALDLNVEDNLDTLYFNIGVCSQRTGLNTQAMHYYQKATKINKFDHQAWYNLAIVAMKMRELDVAVGALRVLQEIGPDQQQIDQLKMIVLPIATTEDEARKEEMWALLDIVLMGV
jgi:tetratricopeptide (TPR) repeat protein